MGLPWLRRVFGRSARTPSLFSVRGHGRSGHMMIDGVIRKLRVAQVLEELQQRPHLAHLLGRQPGLRQPVAVEQDA